MQSRNILLKDLTPNSILNYFTRLNFKVLCKIFYGRMMTSLKDRLDYNLDTFHQYMVSM